jgi:hypothetical protein
VSEIVIRHSRCLSGISLSHPRSGKCILLTWTNIFIAAAYGLAVLVMPPEGRTYLLITAAVFVLIWLAVVASKTSRGPEG